MRFPKISLPFLSKFPPFLSSPSPPPNPSQTIHTFQQNISNNRNIHSKLTLSGFLQGANGGGLEAQIGLKVLGNFSHQALEGQLADKEVGALLKAANFSKSDGARAVTMWLLHTARCGGTLAAYKKSTEKNRVK